jgi:ribosomal protein S14
MKSTIYKDKIKRKNFSLFELERFVLKSIIKNKNIFSSLIYYSILKLDSVFKYASKNKINNYCIYTFRKKSILSKFKMSRITFLNLSRFGYISGIKKSIW